MTDLTPEEKRRIAATILGRTATAATDALDRRIAAMYADWLREGRLPEGWERVSTSRWAGGRGMQRRGPVILGPVIEEEDR